VFFLIVGSVVGYFYPTPKYGVKPYPKWLKLLISMGGGVLAFIYYIATKKDIHSVVIIWVACISFVSCNYSPCSCWNY
jgi:4-hydroxybenzoate polyprenyltransferase